MNIQIKKISPTATIPTCGSQFSAGYDLYADIKEPVTVWPGTREQFNIGISVAIPEGYFGGIFARSGKACKEGVRPSNCVGVIDADYRGPLIVSLTNDDLKPMFVKPGERIAQLIILPFEKIEWQEVKELDETARGEGALGSTGKF